MQSFLITLRDDERELECTSTFEGEHPMAALSQSLEYFSASLERPARLLRIVSIYPMGKTE